MFRRRTRSSTSLSFPRLSVSTRFLLHSLKRLLLFFLHGGSKRDEGRENFASFPHSFQRCQDRLDGFRSDPTLVLSHSLLPPSPTASPSSSLALLPGCYVHLCDPFDMDVIYCCCTLLIASDIQSERRERINRRRGCNDGDEDSYSNQSD